MSDGRPLDAVLAERSAGLAARDSRRIGEAVEHLRRSVTMADGADLPVEAARSRLYLCGVLAMAGELAAAVEEADRAHPALRGGDRARLQLQRANLALAMGATADALEGFTRALPGLRRAGDVESQAKLHNNRAVALLQRGALTPAAAALQHAAALYEELGDGMSVAEIEHNLGFVAARAGDLAGALRWYQRAGERLDELGQSDPVGQRDQVEALLAARLVREARATATSALAALDASGLALSAAEARLLLAEAALLDGDTDAGRANAEAAEMAFVQQGRTGWVALARHVMIRADWQGGDRSAALLARAQDAAPQLDEAGWAVQAVDAHLVAGRVALALGQPGVAHRELGAAAAARHRGPVEARARGWYAEGLMRRADGDSTGADTALRAGIAVLDRYRSALAATELRATTAGHAAELAHEGLARALEAGNPERVLAWAERWRAGSLRLRPVRPPDDPRMAAALAELRTAAAEVGAAASAGQPTAELLRVQTALEDRVRRQARTAGAAGAGGGRAGDTADRRALTVALGEQALVELLDIDGCFHAVVVAGGRASLHELGPSAPATAAIDNLHFALQRLARGRGSGPSLAAAVAAAEHSAAELDVTLLGPLSSRLGERALVLVPTGPLHSVPWGVLPSCRPRPVTVAPSATMWLRGGADARTRVPSGPAPRRVTLAGGPGLPEAAAEVEAIAALHRNATVLTGCDATTAAVAAALDGAALAHVCAHGRFRADNPLFSSLELADGPLTVYDLESLRRAPATVVLSSCDAGLSAVHPGDELLGLAAAVLGLGSRTLVASLLPVPDAATREVMVELHRHLAAGVPAAAALASLRAAHGIDHPAGLVAAVLVCYGVCSGVNDFPRPRDRP